jgi:CubicO group peptidase (beta-lactamase class C family)
MTSVFAQNAVQRLDSLFTTQYAHQQLNGNVLVAQNGAIIYKKSFGYKNIGRHVLNNDKSAFALASISKTFTSLAVLQLKEKGKLKLDDYFVKYFPDFPYKNITIRNLLSHTSGLPDDEDLFSDSLIAKYPGRIWTNEDIIPSLKSGKIQLAFQPGAKWDYSNINYNLLALLVEKLSHLKFQDYLNKYIFVPAKMFHTYPETVFLKSADSNRTINYAYPQHYSPDLAPVNEIADVKKWLTVLHGRLGPGEIISTAEDMLKYDRALYSGKLINPVTLEEAFTPTILNNKKEADATTSAGKASYGLGWFVMADTTAGKIVFHTGKVPGGLTIFIRNLTHKQTVIVLDNAESDALYTTGTNAMKIIDNVPEIIRKRSIAEEYSKILFKDGPDAAAVKLMELRTDTVYHNLSAGEMDYIGHEFIDHGYNNQALEILKINVLLYPSIWQVYNSYAEALLKCNKKEMAIVIYRRSLALKPGNKVATEGLKRLLIHVNQ